MTSLEIALRQLHAQYAPMAAARDEHHAVTGKLFAQTGIIMDGPVCAECGQHKTLVEGGLYCAQCFDTVERYFERHVS